jgi:hypothetical protein
MTGKHPSSLAVRGLVHAEDEGRSRLRGSVDHRAVQLERRRWDRGTLEVADLCHIPRTPGV